MIEAIGSCANITAVNTRTQPKNSLGSIFSPRIAQPESAANTDSKLMISVAVVGSVYFCPTICKVYATVLDMIPAYIMVYLASHSA